MQDLNFEIKKKILNINGEPYEVQCSDLDVLDRAAELKREYAEHEREFDASTDAGIKRTIVFVHRVRDLIDVMLGEGALKKIANGQPIGIEYSIYMMGRIAEAVAQAFREEAESTMPDTPARRKQRAKNAK